MCPGDKSAHSVYTKLYYFRKFTGFTIKLYNSNTHEKVDKQLKFGKCKKSFTRILWCK